MPDDILIRFSVKDDGTPVIERVNEKLKQTKKESQALVPGLEKARMGVTSFLGANSALIGVLGATAVALKSAADAAAEGQMIDKQLEAVLRSTAGAAGMTKDELDKLAVGLMRVSTFDDDAIKKTEILMLTFTNISKDVFPQAIEAALDMSTVLGQDLQSSAIQLGKALNDPVQGVNALRRVGVSFTKDQMAMIKALVESGNTLEAQKLILKELSVEFGGQAKAAANTYTGQMTQLKNEIGYLQGAIGDGLLPELTELTSEVKDATIWISDNIEGIKKWGNILTWVGMPAVRLGGLISKMRREQESSKEPTEEVTEVLRQEGQVVNDLASEMEGFGEEAEKAAEKQRKAMTEAHQAMLGLIGDIQSAEENYQKKAAELIEDRKQIEQDKAEEIAKGWAMDAEKIAEYDQALAENTAKVAENKAEFDKANLEIISGLVERKLMQDGVLDDKEFEWLLKKRQEWGIYSADVVAKAQAAWQEADKITSSIANIPENKTVTINVQTLGGYDYGTEGYNNIAYAGRAVGGPVTAGTPYMVGERGPEMFVPSQSGMIVPNQGSGQAFDYKKMARAIRDALVQVGG